MPAPTINLPVYGAAPNQYTTEADLESVVNTALQSLWTDLITDGGRAFVGRAEAVAAGQGALPAYVGLVFTREGTALVMRGPSMSSDDPLFATWPYWGVIARLNPGVAMRDAGVMTLANVAGTGDAITADLPAAARENGVTATSGTSIIEIIPIASNTGAAEPTLSIDGGAAAVIRSETGAVLTAGQLVAGRSYFLRRRGAVWRIQSGGVAMADLDGEAAARAADVLALTAGIADVANQLEAPNESVEQDAVNWWVWDVLGRALMGWSGTGLRAVLDDWTIENAAPRILGGDVDVVQQTSETLDGRVLERDAAGNAIWLWRNGDKGGLDAIMAQAFWDRGRIAMDIEGGLLSTTAIQLCGVNGQSLTVGGDYLAGLTRAALEAFMGDGCLQLSGTLFGDNVPIVDTLGPRSKGYNPSVPATGTERARPGAASAGMAFPTFAILNAHRRDLGLPMVPILTSCHGIPGILIEDMDDDEATGSGATTVWNNFSFWNAQAKAVADAAGKDILPGWHLWDHGTSAKSSPRGGYLGKWWALQADSIAYWRSQGLQPPRYCMTQPSGDANTTNDGATGWAVCDDILDIVEQGGAVLGTCQHWYEIADNNVHPDAVGTALASETCAWAMAEVEAGRAWSILRPRVLSNAGGALTVRFDSLREDEVLEIEGAAKYGGAGIDAHLGFELTGGAVTGVTVRGHVVVLQYTGAPTALRYAMQVQDVTGIPGNRYTAHRGLLRTSLQKPSKILPGRMLQRAVPSFTLSLGA
ncbi:hypothetical protein [Paracoccus sp. TOH]|uniref:hypothetical protein n=1 Tax=Paracoccus sp. TOH TaxID=1263728 RepID=UPI0025B18AE9|nr:hypothetical protein [Paracoccus sp. TOH]WJS86695.1 hypothetical protein NBE95_19730 [Paracoccus sp. TOH]